MFAGLTSSGTSIDALSAEEDFIELSLLLPRWQLQALESAAKKRGLNMGQMLRKMIGATLISADNVNPN
jgi:hypothetical protein